MRDLWLKDLWLKDLPLKGLPLKDLRRVNALRTDTFLRAPTPCDRSKAPKRASGA